MSKLDELIQKYCPNGVEYKTIGDIATDIFRGAGIKRDEVTEHGIPCVRYGEIYTTYGIWFESCISHTKEEFIKSPKYFEYGDILFAITGESVEDIAKSTAYVGHEKCLAGGDIVVLKHNQNPKYLSYVLATADATKQKSAGKVKSKVVHSSVPSIKNIVIPVPPIEVQEEIVWILDSFTQLTAELQAELQARQRQYEYYRDYLLNFNDVHRGGILEVQWRTLEDVCINCDSMRRPVTSGKREKGDIPYYGASGIVDYVKDYIFDGDYLLVSEDGANLIARNTPIAFSISGKTWVNNHAHVLKFEDYETRRFIELFLNNLDLTPYITGAAQPKLNQKMLNSIKIPMPETCEIKRIVSILDHFDALCNDLSSGLPAEIAARQKQYEYYRDKLLTFQPLA